MSPLRQLFANVSLSLLLVSCGGDDGSSPEGAAGAPQSGRPIYITDKAPSCDADAECDDGNPCNGVETCEDGYCAFGKAINCNDSVACTVDKCDPDTGLCEHSAPDEDGDGFGDAACVDADGQPVGNDCDDADSTRFPGNPEVCTIVFAGDSSVGEGDGHDEDCDPQTFGERDADKDGFIDSRCFNIDDDGNRYEGTDCNDGAVFINPIASEVCDYFDNNCNDEIDENVSITLYDDPDGDGYGGVYDPEDPDAVTLVERVVCPGEVRVADAETDCAPLDRLISPDRDELCDGVDNNCNGLIDENVVPSTWYRDFDGDGYGNPEGGVKSTCERIDHLGWSLFQGDCDDANAMVNPGQTELCDGLDNDCNPTTSFLIGPGNSEDDDKDGVADPLCGVTRSDCNDNNATIYPGARELCDGLDNDCNGVVDTRTETAKWYTDKDGDGFGVTGSAIDSCEPLAGRVTKGGDCNDNNNKVNPAAKDDCTGILSVDDDCDGDTDEGLTPVYSFRDYDGDGYGSEEVVSYCKAVVGADYATAGGDCNDADGATNPGVAEVCDPDSDLDLDCDGKSGCQDAECLNDASCQALFGLALVTPSASPITAYTSYSFDVTVKLTDSSLAPISGANVTVTGPAGALYPSAPVVTGGDGQATFTVAPGMAEGPYAFTVKSGSTAPLIFVVEAQYPPAGTVWSVLNRGAVLSSTKVANFGPSASLYYPTHIDAVADGGAYVCGYYDVGYIDPVGQFRIVAGNGSGSVSGDGAPALSAGLGYPRSIAFDETKKLLYIANSSTVRVVKMGANPPTIHHLIGGGTGPVPGPAELADIGTITSIALRPNGHLLVATSDAVFDYDPSPASKQIKVYGLVANDFDAHYVSAGNTTGLELVQSGDKTMFLGNLRGGDFGAVYNVAGIGGLFGDKSYRMIGRNVYAPHVEMAEGTPMSVSHLSSTVPYSALQDSEGNLIFAPYVSTWGPSLWKVDTVTQRAARFAGSTTAGAGGEYVPRLTATFSGTMSMDKGPDGDIWVAEYTNYPRVRRISGGAEGVRSTLEIALQSPDGESYWPGQPINAVSSLVTDQSMSGVPGIEVRQVPGSSWEALVSSDISDVDGVSFTTGFAELEPGAYSLQTQLWTLDQEVVDADVLSYSVVSPPSGGVTSWLNVNKTYTATSPLEDGLAALTTSLNYVYDVAAASDGSVYVSVSAGGSAIYQITADGYLVKIAGGNGTGVTGDFLPALDAQLQVTDLALDEDHQLLYLLSGNYYTRLIRVIDLNTGIIYPFMGYGAETTFGSPALDFEPGYLYNIHYHEGKLYLPTASNGVYVVDTTLATPLVQSWFAKGTCGTDALSLSSCPEHGCDMVFRNDGKAVMHGYFCGTSITGSKYGLVEISADGDLEQMILGQGSTISSYPYQGVQASSVDSRGLSIDSAGNIYFTERARNWLRKLTPGGMVSTVAGVNTFTAGTTDFVPGASAQFSSPEDVTVLPDGSVLIVDYSNYAIRRYWP